MRPRSVLRGMTLVSLVSVILCSGCGTGSSALPKHEAAAPGRGSIPSSIEDSHTFLIVLENHESDEVVGVHASPYLTRLAREGAMPRNYFALRHPSLPNYLALVAGSTFGIEEDCTECSARGANLATQLQAAGITWRAYMGAMPHACFTGAGTRLYAKKHNPFMYFPNFVSDPRSCSNDVPESALDADLAKGRPPAFAWISPDLCNDGHSCPIAVTDRYLGNLVPRLRRDLGPHGLLVITFDEGTTDEGCCGASGGRIATILLGPQVRRGARFAGDYTEYSLLATLEQRFGLPRLRAARTAPTLAGAFRN